MLNLITKMPHFPIMMSILCMLQFSFCKTAILLKFRTKGMPFINASIYFSEDNT